MNYKIKHSMIISISILTMLNTNAQTESQREAIVETYNIDLLNNLYSNFDYDYISKYNEGVQFLSNQGLPVSGIDTDGSSFSLKGFYSELNDVIYYKTLNNTPTKSSIQTVTAQNLYNGNTVGQNIRGQNLILGIWDGGQPLATHQNLGVTRVINKDGQFTTGTNEGSIQNGINHATHVSGTMIGNGNNQFYARGIASEGSLWANTWDNDLAEMTSEAAQGLLISNHSYGINNRSFINLPGYFGRYTSLSKGIDELTFNANMYLPVFAAGNDRKGIYVGGILTLLNPAKEGYDLLTHETVSKNAVVVAAVEGVSSYTINSDGQNNVIMSEFSQWGTTDDFRIKPDISAKGVTVYSSTGTGITNYSVLSGTSMAAPAVTAVFSLWQQIHNLFWPTANNNSGFMKAASLKAIMAHTANEAGTAAGPDPKFGWGLINAEAGAKLLKDAKEGNAIFKEFTLLNYQKYECVVNVDGSKPLVATISWTDRPSDPVEIAESSVPTLINDLDIRIKKMDTNEIFYPWKINKSWSNLYALKGDNDVDPIEKVEYFNTVTGNAPAGTYKITITHKNELIGLSQNFSLLVSGGIVSSELTLNNEVYEMEKIIVFPNPATDIINVTNLDYDKFEIFDMTGKKINILYTEENDFIKLNISDLAKGTYIIKLIKNKAIEYKRFLKK